MKTNSWSLLPNAPEVVTEPNLVSINDVIYAFCTIAVERYIPAGFSGNLTTPTPSVPEFSWLTILPLLLTIPIALSILRKRVQGNV